VSRPAPRRSSRGPIVIGVALALVYLGGAALTARLDPLQGRALLDGSFTGAPYQWACPPPALAAGNKEPASVAEEIPVSPQGGSESAGMSTADLQATVLLSQGAFPSKPGESSVLLRITPMCASDAGPLPTGRQPQGNVYRVQATYQLGGDAVDVVQPSAQLVLVYPAPPNPGTFEGTVFESDDATTWTALRTQISSARHQALAESPRLGYFVVGALPQPTPSFVGTGGGGAGSVLRIVLIALLVVGAGTAAWFISGRWLQRRAAHEEGAWENDDGDAGP
jgi:hypothetical protein